MQPDGADTATAAAGNDPARLRAVSAAPGRRRRPDPPARVTVVLDSGEEVLLPADSALGRAIGQLTGLLAHW